MLPALSERHDLPQHPGPLMPLGEKGQMGERIDLLFDLDLYIIIARTCVGKQVLHYLHYLHYLRVYRGGRLGGSKRTPASSAKWKAVPRCILWSPFFKELEKSRSAFSRLNFTDREHRAMKPSRPASPQSLAMANAKRTYSQYPGGDIYTRRTNRFY